MPVGIDDIWLLGVGFVNVDKQGHSKDFEKGGQIRMTI